MSRDKIAPSCTTVDSPTHDLEYEHPAFGCVTVSNWTGGGRSVRLFGSDLGHSQGVSLCFREAKMSRGLSYDHHMPGNVLLEVEMSESQWARFVASSGKGSGTPVTITAKRTGGIEEPPRISEPEASKREVHGQEMREALQAKLVKAQELTSAIGELVNNPGSISKTALKALHRQLDNAIGNLPGNVQFVYDQFAEATEQVAEDAKLEIEAFVDNLATHLGMEQLRQAAPKMLAESTKE